MMKWPHVAVRGAAVLALILAACDGKESAGTAEVPYKPAEAPTNSATPTPSPPMPAPAETASRVSIKTADYEFDYSYPAQAAAIAPLAAWLNHDRARMRRELANNGYGARMDAKSEGIDYHPYSSEEEWKVVTDTPRFLSLSALGYDYTGGAHGNPYSEAIVWDKSSSRRLKPEQLFLSPKALQAAIGADFCTRLDKEREERRGEKVDRFSDDPFDKCPNVSETTLILGSTDRRAIDRLGLLADPYVAGAYAEGDYEVTVPVTQAVIDAVKPEFRAGFAQQQQR